MSNSYFRFKQFTVNQDKCAMKVCTDACLLGAFAAKEIESRKSEIKNILDIGSGTGLLSMMLAQKTSTNIDAVEVDEAAAQQARENFDGSGWSNRLKVYNCSIQQFNVSNRRRENHYDVIISNPPFFEDSLKSGDKGKNLAKHSSNLTYEELAKTVSQNLCEEGIFFILLPYLQFKTFSQKAIEYNLFPHQQLNIKQTPTHSYFRTIGIFSKQHTSEVKTATMTIKEEDKGYSKSFIDLLKDYYLYL